MKTNATVAPLRKDAGFNQFQFDMYCARHHHCESFDAIGGGALLTVDGRVNSRPWPAMEFTRDFIVMIHFYFLFETVSP